MKAFIGPLGLLFALCANTTPAEPRNTVLVDFEALPFETCSPYTEDQGVTLSGGRVWPGPNINPSRVYQLTQSLGSYYCGGSVVSISFDEPASHLSVDVFAESWRVLTLEDNAGWTRTINMWQEVPPGASSGSLTIGIPSDRIRSLSIRDHCYYPFTCGTVASFSLDNIKFRVDRPCLEINGSTHVQPNDANQSPTANAGTITVAVTDCDGGALEGIEVRTKILPVDGSGGHSHEVVPSALRPAGGLRENGASGVGTGFIVRSSDPHGEIKLEFVPPEISGQYLITAECVSIDCFEPESPLEILVSVPGLRPIPGDSEFYTLKEYLEGTERGKNIGNNGKHDDENHFLTESAATALQNLAMNYASFFDNLFVRAPEKLHINDASLPLGGLFDYTGSWAKPHNRHRRGTVVDVRANNTCGLGACPGAIPRQYRPLFEQVAAQSGVRWRHEDVDQQNEHYHVLLKGVQQ